MKINLPDSYQEKNFKLIDGVLTSMSGESQPKKPTISGKKEAIVSFCPCCGAKFEETCETGIQINCASEEGGCGRTFLVRI